tara:strand:+ start:146 stop:613 length:468 start_codon:yes stop_codon:yes gene_type:complete
MSSTLSLYIPVISIFISESYIKKIFKSKNIGDVLKVEFVKNIEKNRYEAFIHFSEWFNSEESKKLQEDINNINTKTKFIYDDNNKFWPLLVNKNPHKRVNNPKYEMLDSNLVKNVYANNINKFEFKNVPKTDANKKFKNVFTENNNITFASVAKM